MPCGRPTRPTGTRSGSDGNGLACATALADDLELEPAPRVRPARADDGPQRTGDPSLPPDHLADVVLGDVEPEEERPVVVLDLLDPHRVRLVHEPTRERLEQLRHYLEMPLALSLIHISEPTRRTPISYAVFC